MAAPQTRQIPVVAPPLRVEHMRRVHGTLVFFRCCSGLFAPPVILARDRVPTSRRWQTLFTRIAAAEGNGEGGREEKKKEQERPAKEGAESHCAAGRERGPQRQRTNGFSCPDASEGGPLLLPPTRTGVAREPPRCSGQYANYEKGGDRYMGREGMPRMSRCGATASLKIAQGAGCLRLCGEP